MRLYPRLIEPVLKTALADTPVVYLLGPRQVGKTTLVQQLKPKRAYISFDDQSMVTAARNDPLGFVHGLPDPVILDEVQRVPELLPAIKSSIDRERKPGRFLLTGSANLLLLPKVKESLAGRMEVVQLNPLSEIEKHRGTSSLVKTLSRYGELKPEAAAEEFEEGISGHIEAGVRQVVQLALDESRAES